MRTPLLMTAFVLASLTALTVYPAFLPSPEPPIDTRAPDPLESGELWVLTLQGPGALRRGPDGPTGFEAELTGRFADSLGLEVRYEVRDSIGEALEALEAGEGHVLAAGLTVTEARRERVRFGPAYKNVREELVCRRDGARPRTAEELAGLRLAVVSGSTYAETLARLAEDRPGIVWEERDAPSAMPLIRDVARERLDCTLADSHLVALARRRFPDLVAPFALTGERPLAWALPNEPGPLDEALHDWFSDMHAGGTLLELDVRWFGRFDEFDYVDVRAFARRLESRLPAFEDYFREAAEAQDFDWRLLAAQAYQESHWDADAVSPTGVRGLMMLTLPTAERVGVSNRLDPEQSVRGGAAYLRDLYERIPEEVSGADRLWFALAAYNVGMGHLYDARRVAERRGLDKNSWDDLAEALPALSQPEVYETLRYGYARGREPVDYVNRVREYYARMRVSRPEAVLNPPAPPTPLPG